MVPETARWGDMLTPDVYTGVDLFTRDEFWYWARDEVNYSWTDTRQPAGESGYYVRVQQKDKELAWSSPIWSTLKK